ncbi:hypothetical protein GW17_00058959 [Ensete ventricosum]|nr:hypothetical protein GW17_00058959 [Ensete ventricosum]
MSVCTSSSTSVKVEVSNSGQLCVSKIGTSELAIWFSLFLEPEPKVLHKGLVKVGTLNVTPPTIRLGTGTERVRDLVLGNFCLPPPPCYQVGVLYLLVG